MGIYPVANCCRLLLSSIAVAIVYSSPPIGDRAWREQDTAPTCLFRRDDSTNWWVRLRSGNQRIEKSLRTSDRREAEILAAPMIAEHKAALLAARRRLETRPYTLDPDRFDPAAAADLVAPPARAPSFLQKGISAPAAEVVRRGARLSEQGTNSTLRYVLQGQDPM